MNSPGISRRSTLSALVGAGGLYLATPFKILAQQPAHSPERQDIAMLSPTELILHNTIVIETTLKSGEISRGTGFMFRLFSTPAGGAEVIVTNKHVVKDAVTGRFTITPQDKNGLPDVGNISIIEYEKFESLWLGHPDPNIDLTIFPLNVISKDMEQHGKKIFMPYIEPSIVPTDQEAKDLLPLEEVLVVGYPDGISDTKNNLPIARKGITATPYYVDFNGTPNFLIDSAIFPGSSGSPVYLFNQGTWVTRNGATVAGGYRIKLLGVVHSVALHTSRGEVKIVPAPTSTKSVVDYATPNNLGICVKASKILDFEPLLIKTGGARLPDGYVMRAPH